MLTRATGNKNFLIVQQFLHGRADLQLSTDLLMIFNGNKMDGQVNVRRSRGRVSLYLGVHR